MGPELAGRGVAHVPRDAHPVPEVLERDGELPRDGGVAGWAVGQRGRVRVPAQQRGRHQPQARLHIGQRVQVRYRVGVRKRRRELLVALLPRPPQRELRHVFVVLQQRVCRLVARRLLPWVHRGADWLHVAGGERGQGESPVGPCAVNLAPQPLPPGRRAPGPVLRGDVHYVRVVVALRGHVGGQRLKRVHPPLDPRPAPLPAHLEAPPVRDRGAHALHVRYEGQVHDGQVGQEPRPLCKPQLSVYLVQHLLEVLAAAPAEGGAEDQPAPGGEGLPL
mmetsp:Transcript_35223/g.77606  ORF Transcript_35223/g.77606 Transcript_35223/m.77606 type:complete len:277 (+) Transcript_35223:189-1019(+)